MTTAPRMLIAGREISESAPPLVVAELSANHDGSLDRALRLLECAKAAGAGAAKLQTYRPDTITLDGTGPEFRIDDGPWSGQTLHELYQRAHTPWEWHPQLFQRARELDLLLFSSPFDNTAVDLLEQLDCPAYKIASFEAVDLALIRYVAATGKPMIISTGMADAAEIAEAVATAKAAGCRELALLHCVSGYPAPAADYNLRTMCDMRQRFGLLTGLSDHTLGTATAVAGVALGACIIEKHFTLDRQGGGPDDEFSLEPAEFAELCASARTAWDALGRVSYDRQASELGNVKFRRSLYFVRDLRAGDRVTADCVRSVRPGYGLSPRYLDLILGKAVIREVRAMTPVCRDCFGHLD